MPRFRKKPVIVFAEQWFPGTQVKGVEYLSRNVPVFDEFDSDVEYFWGIRTLEGDMRVSPGDWVITGVHGEIYPCKPAIFEETYECVD